ncbi:HD domain-containing protein [Carnimonas bestiolae]|uniref:HD domain-containing protein n=1 Tax=Carnimonas bestiolae TaxID=3402172 RepID=UPI003EDC1CDC
MQDIATLEARWQAILRALAGAQSDGDAAHDISHFERVWATAKQILPAHPEAQPQVVMAACYLHDLVNLPKNHPQRAEASRRSAQCAVQTLKEHDFPAQQLDDVAHAIEAHSFSAGITPQTIDAKIVQDADRLDALGAIGIARMLYVSGALQRTISHPTDPLAEQRPLDDSRYTLDHIETKLLTLPSLLHTNTAKTIAAARCQWVREFREQFIAECAGER